VRRLALVLLGLLVCAAPAHAAGTGDVELVPASRDGAPQTSFRVAPDDDALRFELVNLADEPRTARLYAASADRSEGGGIGIGATGSAPWLQLPDAEIVLAGGETRAFTAPLDLRALPEQREQLGAVVLEAPQGAVTVRVATLVTVEPRPALPLPLWAVALAVIALGLALFGLWVARRRRREDAEPAPERDLVGV
jgi:hypothetical protein